MNMLSLLVFKIEATTILAFTYKPMKPFDVTAVKIIIRLDLLARCFIFCVNFKAEK